MSSASPPPAALRDEGRGGGAKDHDDDNQKWHRSPSSPRRGLTRPGDDEKSDIESQRPLPPPCCSDDDDDDDDDDADDGMAYSSAASSSTKSPPSEKKQQPIDEAMDIEAQRPPPGGDRNMASSSAATEAADDERRSLAAVIDMRGVALSAPEEEDLTPAPEIVPRVYLDKPRDSWDYHADDSFEIKQEVAISEVEQEIGVATTPEAPEQQRDGQDSGAPQQWEEEQRQQQTEEHQPVVQEQEPEQEEEEQQQQQQPAKPAAIPRIKSDFKSKLKLSDLILPSAGDDLPEPPEPPSAATAPAETAAEQVPESSPTDSNNGDLLYPLSSRRKPPRPTIYRAKTRLQDPPPMTPAVSDQLASLWSDAAGTHGRRSTAMIHQPVEDEAGQFGGRFGPVTGRRVSLARPPSAAQEDDPPAQQPKLSIPAAGKKSVSIGGGDAAAGVPPAAAPSRLFSTSRLALFSPSAAGLLSKLSKGNLATDEERDPLDDDAIPAYKKKKKNKGQRRWLVFIQWFALASLSFVLIFAVKFHKLKMVIWRDIALWQWLSLAIVCVSGRLIAGWCVKLLVAMIERHYILKKRVLYFIYGLRHAVRNCIWLALVIGVWKLVFKNIELTDKTNTTSIVTKVLWCLFTTSCLWMLKILAVKVAANSFHRAAYFDRVQDCLFHQYVLETLSAPRLGQQADSGFRQTSLSRHGRRSRDPSPVRGAGRGRASEQQQQQQQQQQAANAESTESRLEQQISRPQRPSEKLATTVEEDEAPQPSPVSLARAPSKSYLGTGSRQNLRSASRLNLGSTTSSLAPGATTATAAAAASSASPGAAPVRSPSSKQKVSVVDHAAGGPLIARSSVPIGQEKLQELTSETVSAWTLKRLMKMIRKTNIATFSSLLEQEVGESIDSEAQAKAAAKHIFYNIARPGEKFLSLSDFTFFLPEDQATRAFGLFELNDAGHITKKALMKWVVNVYKERRALALTLSDNRTVVAKLHRVLDVLLLGIAITICFLIMGVNTQKLLVGFSSVLLPAVFVFGNAARSTFESLIFLFVMHPFDVGDRIMVDGNTMIVEEMNILNTIFLSGSNEKIYYPNSVLATKPISNYYRSPDQWDSIEFQIHSGTPVEQLGLLKERMTRYIESLPQFWYPVFRIVCKDIEDANRMKMALWIQHHLNYQESGERWQRRSNMILFMKTQLEELNIGYQLPKQEILVTGFPVLDVPGPRHSAAPH